MGRRYAVGLAAFAAVVCAAAARGQEAGSPEVAAPSEVAGSPDAAGTIDAADPSARSVCELQWVVDRSRASSLRCMSCHDGASGPGVSFMMAGGGAGAGMDHPVEVDYAQARVRRGHQYVPEAHLPADVPLVGGKVACTSCHDGRSTRAKHVAADPARLCAACHNM